MSLYSLSRQIQRLDEKSRERKHFTGDFRCNCSQFESLEQFQAEIQKNRSKGYRIIVCRDIEVDEYGHPFICFANGLRIPDGFSM